MEVLGVTHHQLGAAGDAAHPAYRDSGMAGSTGGGPPAGLGRRPTSRMPRPPCAPCSTTLRPDVVVTYDATGGYGHPDHVRTHEATCRAVATSADAPVLYAVLTPLSWAVEDRRWLAEHVPTDRGLVVPGRRRPLRVVGRPRRRW